MEQRFASAGRAGRGLGLALSAALAAACHDETLVAILPAPVVVADAQDAAELDAFAGEAGPDADAGDGGGIGETDAGGPKISGLVVHDTDPTRVTLWSIQHDFEIGQNGVYPWGDWPKTYFLTLDPAGMVMLGKDYIAVASESKKYVGGPQATVTFSAPADLYMIFDDRWMTQTWTAGWTDTGWNMTVYESVNRPSLPFSVLTRSVPAGPLDLPPIGDNTGYNFIIVVN
jgi:hypothetical protein